MYSLQYGLFNEVGWEERESLRREEREHLKIEGRRKDAEGQEIREYWAGEK